MFEPEDGAYPEMSPEMVKLIRIRLKAFGQTQAMLSRAMIRENTAHTPYNSGYVSALMTKKLGLPDSVRWQISYLLDIPEKMLVPDGYVLYSWDGIRNFMFKDGLPPPGGYRVAGDGVAIPMVTVLAA